MPDAEDWERHELPSLRGIAYKAKTQPGYRFRDLSRNIDETLLSHCFVRKLNKKAASGVDRMTYIGYKENFAANITNLIDRLKRGGYRAKLVKRKHIPKGAGKTRPLGIPVIEDKLLQTAVSEILSAIYEQDFHPFSYGYRPKRSARQAADDLVVRMQFGRFGYVVEADIKGFFNHIDHDKLLEMLAQRIDDRRFLRLINKWLKAGILEEDMGIPLHSRGKASSTRKQAPRKVAASPRYSPISTCTTSSMNGSRTSSNPTVKEMQSSAGMPMILSAHFNTQAMQNGFIKRYPGD